MKRSGVKEAGAEVFRILSDDSDIEFGNILRERTEISLVIVQLSVHPSDREHLKT